jgi:hypothetical protein
MNEGIKDKLDFKIPCSDSSNICTFRIADFGCSVGSLMERSCGCDWLDLQVDQTVRMSRFVIWCDAVYRELGTPGDVAPPDLKANCFKG